MNVDTDNFREVKDYIYKNKLIPRSKTISFDFEFTGLKYENNERQRTQHFPFEKYKKMSKVATKFTIIQCGITFFTHQPAGIIAHPYNFYLFPREVCGRDPVLSLQSSAVQFNTNQNMDWNRWIKKGINYVKLSQIKNFEGHRTSEEMVSNLDVQLKQLFEKSIDIINNMKQKQKQTIKIPKSGSNIMKKIFDRYILENDCLIKFTLNKQQQQIKFLFERISRQQQVEIKQKIRTQTQGFTELFDKIWNESDATLVGHNCFYDLLYMYEAFVDTLPQKYTHFKSQLTKTKHQFYDTKCLIDLYDNTMQRFKNGTSLQEIYQYITQHEKNNLDNHPKVKLQKGFEAYDLKNQILHEAGFDSYLTGWIFYQLTKKFPQNFQNYKSIINCNRSYFQINIKNTDKIKKNVTVFVFLLGSQFINKEDLRKMKAQEMKEIKRVLTEQKIISFVTLHEGFKEIFITVKDKNKVGEVVKILYYFNKKSQKVYSFEKYIQIKAQYYTKHPDKM